MKTLFIFFLLNLLTIAGLCAHCSNFNLKHYSIENGLPNNNINFIIQDSIGFIWIGTGEGLCRFDGTNFKLFPNNTTKQNKANNVTSICIIEDKKLMVGTEYGLYVFDNKLEIFKPFEYKGKKGSQYLTEFITCLLIDKNNDLWIGGNNGKIYRYSKRNNDFITFKLDSNKFPILKIISDNQNNIWASSMNSLYKLNKSTNKFEIFPIKNNPSLYSMALYIDKKDFLWIGTWNNGLWKLDINKHTVEKFLIPGSKDGVLHIHSIEKNSDETIYIGSDNGLTVFNTLTKKSVQYNNNNVLCANSVYPIYKDKEGGVWIGTYYNGINYMPPNIKSFQGYSYKDNKNYLFKGNIISNFCEDPHGNVWIGSDDGGLSLFSPISKEFIDFKHRKELQSYNVHGLYIDNDNLLIGTYGNGFKKLNLKNNNLSDFTTKGLYDNCVYSIYKDRKDTLWVGTMHGICKYDKSKNEFISGYKTESLINSIAEDNNNNIWVCTANNGLFKYDRIQNKWKHFLKDNIVNDIFIDKENTIWIASGKGLIKFNDNKFSPVSLKLKNQNINAIIEDDNNLWLTTSKGLIKYHPVTGELQYFSKSDGLQNESFITASAIKTKNGEIYIGSINGFNHFYPHEIKRNNLTPNIVFTRLEIFNNNICIDKKGILNKSLNDIKELNLSYKDNVFSIAFAALSFCSPEKNKFAYKLEGFDHEWNYIDNQNKITYTNLPYKKYTLKVKGSNNDNIWNEKGIALDIIINPPFYLTNEFKIAYIILAILISITLLLYINKRNEIKHAKEYNRLKIKQEKEVQEAKIEFFTMVAHEIRTPVSLIIGPLEKVMEVTSHKSEQIKNDLDIIYRNSNRLLYLVNQLLDFKKVEQKEFKMQFSTYNINEIVESVCERFNPSLKQKNVSLNIKYDSNPLIVDVDREAIIKVLSNLMSNASKYTDDEINVTIENDNNNFYIYVKDNGKGISEDDIKNIFKPFHQGKNHKAGTGIGLCIVKGIIDAHHGNINVTSSPNNGCEFKITLPLHQKSKEEKESFDVKDFIRAKYDVIHERSNSLINKPKILIADDNEDMIEFLSTNFSHNYHVFTAIDGETAINILKKNDITLIISDWMMPKMNGVELCSYVRNSQQFSHIPFIMLTAKTDNTSKVVGVSCGADLYIEKPFSFKYLEACIKNILELRKQLRIKFSKMPMVPIQTLASNNYDEKFLNNINTIIEENFSNPKLSVDFLAEHLCISRSGLFVKIKRLANVTPNEMIQIIRLKKAAALLLENKYRINEISSMVGFNNASYFSKCFQKQFRIKPAEFIKMQLNKEN